MRKVFWCSLAGGIVVLGGVFTTAFFAARHPQSLAGRLVLSAGRIATSASPVTMVNSAIVRLEKAEAAPEGSPAAGGEEPAEPAEAQEVHGEIVIDEQQERVTQTIDPSAFENLVRVANDDAVECPAGATECPARMPACGEEECEKLGMPCSEGEVEEQEEPATGPTGAAEKLFRLFEKAVKQSDEGAIEAVEPAKPECHENSYHHSHYSGCPYTGHGSMHCPAGCSPPAAQPAPLTQPGAEEASEPTKPEQHSSALRSIRRFGTRGVETVAPAAPKLDTMEYRTGDGQLYDFGRGM